MDGYRRFLTPKKALLETELGYLTEVDHHDHEALAAFAVESGEPLGVARFVRSTEDPGAAEAAVAVVDDWHDRGVGSVLLEAWQIALARRAYGVSRRRCWRATPRRSRSCSSTSGSRGSSRPARATRVCASVFSERGSEVRAARGAAPRRT